MRAYFFSLPGPVLSARATVASRELLPEATDGPLSIFAESSSDAIFVRILDDCVP